RATSAVMVAVVSPTAQRSTVRANWLVSPPPLRRSSRVASRATCSTCATSAPVSLCGTVVRPSASIIRPMGSPTGPPTATAATVALSPRRRASLSRPPPPVRAPGGGGPVPEADHLRSGEPHAGRLLVGREDGGGHGPAVLAPLHL